MNHYKDENGVLFNKLGFDGAKALERKECEITGAASNELVNNPIKSNFDLKHLTQIHDYLFNEVYEWAGQHLTVEKPK